MEGCQAGLEAHFTSILFDDDILILVVIMSVVELRHFFYDPEHLPVQLLFNVNFQQVTQPCLAANQLVNKDIAQRGGFLLDSRLWFRDELFKARIHRRFEFRVKFQHHREHPDKVDQPTDRNYRMMLFIFSQLNEVGYDELR